MLSILWYNIKISSNIKYCFTCVDARERRYTARLVSRTLQALCRLCLGDYSETLNDRFDRSATCAMALSRWRS